MHITRELATKSASVPAQLTEGATQSTNADVNASTGSGSGRHHPSLTKRTDAHHARPTGKGGKGGGYSSQC